jgi:hypothetical protein
VSNDLAALAAEAYIYGFPLIFDLPDRAPGPAAGCRTGRHPRDSAHHQGSDLDQRRAVRGRARPVADQRIAGRSGTDVAPSRSAARRGEGRRVIYQNDARDPLLPRTRDARISGSPGAPPARERSASGPACVCTSPGRPATDTCRCSHRSSADNGRRWACALLHDSAARIPRIRLPPFNSSTCRLPHSTRVQVPVERRCRPLALPGPSACPSWT